MKSFFTYIPFLFFVLLMLIFIAPFRLRTRIKAIWAMALLFCASKFVCFNAFGGDAFAPDLPAAVVLGWGWAYFGMCILLVLACIAAPFRVLLHYFARNLVPAKVWLVGLPVISWAIAAVGVYNSVKPPEVKEVLIASERVPATLDGYKIVHISDIHVSSSLRRWRTEEIVRRANDAQADLICLTGDYVDGMCRRRKSDFEPIRNLKAKDGVYFVSGNHEYYIDSVEWHALHNSWGLQFLNNKCVFPRKDLAVAGVVDTAANRHYLCADASGALASATNGEFRVLLQHRPHIDYAGIYGNNYSYRCDLQLSGHTHGGVMPIMRKLVGRYNAGYVRGLYKEPSGKFTYVSSGAGQWAGFPVRFFNDSEITVLTLKHKEPAIP